MDSKVILLVILAALASGCADSSGGGNGIVINELSVQPQQLSAGNSASINVEAVNAGQLEGEVNVGDKGTEVLTNYCSDIFSIEDFRASATNPSTENNTFSLGTDDRLRLTWRLKQNREDEIPLQGYPCDLRFQMPFNYSVRAYKQLQIKESRESSGSTDLVSDISEGPLTIDMEVIGSTADQRNTILERDNASIYLTAYNTDSEDSSYQGLINIHNISITSAGAIDLQDNCGEKGTVALASGNKEIYRCNINQTELGSPSVRGEVEARINYTFVKDLGSRSIEVKYNG